MAKKLGYVFVGLTLLGFVVAYTGWRFGQPVWISIGVAVAGLGIAAGGVQDMITRYVSISYQEARSQVQTYSGLSAVLFGIMWILVGLCLFGGGLIYTIGLDNLMWDYVQAHPGPVMVMIGLMMMAYGGVEVLGAREDRLSASFWNFLGSVPARIFGVVLIVIGLAVVTAGAWELVAPNNFDTVIAQLKDTFLPPMPK